MNGPKSMLPVRAQGDGVKSVRLITMFNHTFKFLQLYQVVERWQATGSLLSPCL